MNEFCQDKDLLAIEPILFIGGGLPSQQLASGPAATLEGTTFTAAGKDFPAAGVKPGMVLTLYATTPSEGQAAEIVSVDGPTVLTVSVLRNDDSQPPIAPPAVGTSFHIRTYRPQIIAASDALAEKLQRMRESAGISSQITVCTRLRQATALAALANIFLARSQENSAGDINYVKALHYRGRADAAAAQLTVSCDLDGDGAAETTRTPGNITLRRV